VGVCDDGGYLENKDREVKMRQIALALGDWQTELPRGRRMTACEDESIGRLASLS
jgi:hypothetical protein